MSTLAKAVKFRSLADELHDREYNKMIYRLIKRCPRADVLTWLFKQFIQSKDQSFEQQLLNNAIADSSKIIQCRNENQNDDKSGNKTIAESLSGDLYREVASYLMDTEYFAFAKTSRAIYVGCNSPNSLRYLDLIDVDDYSFIDLTKYPQLRHLKIDFTLFDEFDLPTDGSTVCNHLTHFTLYADGEQDIDINSFMNDQSLNFEHLQQLELENFAKKGHWFNVNIFRRLLSKFSMIESLSFHAFYCRTSNIDDQTMLSMLPNICKINMNGMKRETTDQFMRLYGEKLTSLMVKPHRNRYRVPDLAYSNLTDLLVIGPDEKCTNIAIILKSAKMLKNVEINHGSEAPIIGSCLADQVLRIFQNRH